MELSIGINYKVCNLGSYGANWIYDGTGFNYAGNGIVSAIYSNHPTLLPGYIYNKSWYTLSVNSNGALPNTEIFIGKQESGGKYDCYPV